VQGLPKLPRSTVKPVLLDVAPLAAIVQGPITFPVAAIPLPLPLPEAEAEAEPDPDPEEVTTFLPVRPVRPVPIQPPKQDRN
jgi:hypothetical protein